jgi:hypothetical protein
MSSEFKDDEVWIAIRINDLFQPRMVNDIYVLMDAASEYIFGTALLTTVNAVHEEDIEILFKKAIAITSKWPNVLIMPEHSIAEDVFSKLAAEKGFAFSTVPLANLCPIMEPLKESFAPFFR